LGWGGVGDRANRRQLGEEKKVPMKKGKKIAKIRRSAGNRKKRGEKNTKI